MAKGGGTEFTRDELIFDPLVEQIDNFYEKVLQTPEVSNKSVEQQAGILKQVNKVLTSTKDTQKAAKDSGKEMQDLFNDVEISQGAGSLKEKIVGYYKGPKNILEVIGTGIVKGAVKLDTAASRIDGVPKHHREARLKRLDEKYNATDPLHVRDLGTAEGEKPLGISDIRKHIDKILKSRAEQFPGELAEKKEAEQRREAEEREAKRVEAEQKAALKQQLKKLSKDDRFAISRNEDYKNATNAERIEIVKNKIEKDEIEKDEIVEKRKDDLLPIIRAGVPIEDIAQQSGLSVDDINNIDHSAEEGLSVREYKQALKQQQELDKEQQKKQPTRPREDLQGQEVGEQQGDKKQPASVGEDYRTWENPATIPIIPAEGKKRGRRQPKLKEPPVQSQGTSEKEPAKPRAGEYGNEKTYFDGSAEKDKSDRRKSGQASRKKEPPAVTGYNPRQQYQQRGIQEESASSLAVQPDQEAVDARRERYQRKEGRQRGIPEGYEVAPEVGRQINDILNGGQEAARASNRSEGSGYRQMVQQGQQRGQRDLRHAGPPLDSEVDYGARGGRRPHGSGHHGGGRGGRH